MPGFLRWKNRGRFLSMGRETARGLPWLLPGQAAPPGFLPVRHHHADVPGGFTADVPGGFTADVPGGFTADVPRGSTKLLAKVCRPKLTMGRV